MLESIGATWKKSDTWPWRLTLTGRGRLPNSDEVNVERHVTVFLHPRSDQNLLRAVLIVSQGCPSNMLEPRFTMQPLKAKYKGVHIHYIGRGQTPFPSLRPSPTPFISVWNCHHPFSIAIYGVPIPPHYRRPHPAPLQYVLFSSLSPSPSLYLPKRIQPHSSHWDWGYRIPSI